MNPSSTIAPHILVLALFLSVTWGIYLIYTVNDYRMVKTRRVVSTKQGFEPLDGERRRGELVAAFRRMLVALCVWSLPFSFVIRTSMVLAGFGDDLIGQIVFFALVGPNVVGSIFAVVSLRFD